MFMFYKTYKITKEYFLFLDGYSLCLHNIWEYQNEIPTGLRMNGANCWSRIASFNSGKYKKSGILFLIKPKWNHW